MDLQSWRQSPAAARDVPLFSTGQDRVVETQTRGSKRRLCRHLGMLAYITTHPMAAPGPVRFLTIPALIHLEGGNNL